jgi:hypothetical protein
MALCQCWKKAIQRRDQKILENKVWNIFVSKQRPFSYFFFKKAAFEKASFNDNQWKRLAFLTLNVKNDFFMWKDVIKRCTFYILKKNLVSKLQGLKDESLKTLRAATGLTDQELNDRYQEFHSNFPSGVMTYREFKELSGQILDPTGNHNYFTTLIYRLLVRTRVITAFIKENYCDSCKLIGQPL